jgi:hypothetical protein
MYGGGGGGTGRAWTVTSGGGGVTQTPRILSKVSPKLHGLIINEPGPLTGVAPAAILAGVLHTVSLIVLLHTNVVTPDGQHDLFG